MTRRPACIAGALAVAIATVTPSAARSVAPAPATWALVVGGGPQVASPVERMRPGDSVFVCILLPFVERKGAVYFVPFGSQEAEVWTLLGQDEIDAFLARTQPRKALVITTDCTETLRLDIRQQSSRQLRVHARQPAVTHIRFCDRSAPDRGAGRRRAGRRAGDASGRRQAHRG